MLDMLKSHLASLTGLDHAAWTGSTRLTELELDALTLLKLATRLEDSLGLEIGDSELLDLDSFHAIAHELNRRTPSRPIMVHPPAHITPPVADGGTGGEDLAQERLLAAGEVALAVPGTPMVISQFLAGTVDTRALARAVTALSALHPVLAARIEAADHGLVLRRSPAWPAPTLHEHAGPGRADEPFRIGDPLLRAALAPEADGYRFTLAVSHAIGDGTSMAALWAALWEVYRAEGAGQVPDLPPSAAGLPRPVQESYDGRFTEQEIAAYLAERSAQTAGRPLATITPLATGPDGGPGTGTGAHVGRIVVDAEQALRLEQAALNAGTTLNAMVCGVALTAVRTQTSAHQGPAMMTCASTVDIRKRVRPRIPAHHLVMAVAVPQFVIEAGPVPHPADLGRAVGQQMRAMAKSGGVDRAFAAMPQLLTDTAAAMPPSVIVSSVLGRTPASAPVGAGPMEAYAYAPGPVPALYVQSLPEQGLALSVVLPRAWFTAAQCHDLTTAVSAALTRALDDA